MDITLTLLTLTQLTLVTAALILTIMKVLSSRDATSEEDEPDR